MLKTFQFWTTQYANYIQSAIDDGNPVRLTYAQWFNTRRHVTEYPRRRKYVWLIEKEDQPPQQPSNE